jgi:hypothetical protein
VTDWLILAVYVAVWLVYGWRLTIHILDVQVRRSKSLYGDAEKAAKEWLGISMYGGFALALFWPVVAPVRFIYRLASTGGLFRTPAEREETERRELEQLRKLAKEHGLPMPETDRKGAA